MLIVQTDIFSQSQRVQNITISDLKGLVHKLAPKSFFHSYASKNTYFIIIILFDIEIEHKNTKNVRKSLCLWWGSNPCRSITH